MLAKLRASLREMGEAQAEGMTATEYARRKSLGHTVNRSAPAMAVHGE